MRHLCASAAALVLTAAVPVFFLPACSDDAASDTTAPDASADATDDAVVDAEIDADIPPTLIGSKWAEPTLASRIQITLRADPDRDRQDFPVVVALPPLDGYLQPGIKVHTTDITDGSTTEGTGYTQPDGTIPEIAFTAIGGTPAGKTRRFILYFNTGPQPAAWNHSPEGWASFSKQSGSGNIDTTTLHSDRYDLQREIDTAKKRLLAGRRVGKNTWLKDATGQQLADGFVEAYQLETPSKTWPVVSLSQEPFTETSSHGDTFAAAASWLWKGISKPIAHDSMVTARMFHPWPLVESVVSFSAASSNSDVRFSADSFSARSIYFTDTYDRMWSDTRGDQAIDKVWDSSMRWLVTYDSKTDKGFGWFSFHPTVIRADKDSKGQDIYDSYSGAAGGSRAYRYLWMSSPHKDEILRTFRDMAPGVKLSSIESRDLNIVKPLQDEFYFPKDDLQVTITTPGNNQSVSATLTKVDGSPVDLPLVKMDDMPVWQLSKPIALSDSDPVGTWKVHAESAGVGRDVSFEFRRPKHPKLMFDAADIPNLRARKDNAAYADIWASMLKSAKGYDEPITDPGPGKDIRSYAERLINLALIQLIDPSQPYEQKLWSYFFTMLRYPNWSDDAAVPFNNLDLTIGHFLTALSLTYDWHYDKLSPAQRREVRGMLIHVAERHAASHNLRSYPDIDWHHFGTVTNNHYWINHQGVAAAAFVLADEVAESRRLPLQQHVERDLQTILGVLEPDGGSEEGAAYHSYGQINLYPWIDMRDHALGKHAAQSSPWFEQTVLYDLYSIFPGGSDNFGGVANFGDCPPMPYQSPRTIQAWSASRLSNGYAQWMANHLDYPRITPYSFLWYDPTVPEKSPTTLPTSHLFANKGIFVWRSSWDNDATYVTIKSGSYFGGHEQPDAGHFLLYRAGVPYITDHGYSYLKMTDEHNLMLLDGQGEHGEGKQWMPAIDPANWAHIDQHLSDKNYFDVISDPTPMVLSDKVTGWQRELVGLGKDIFIVRDAVQASSAIDMKWLLHAQRTKPPKNVNYGYDYRTLRKENPFSGGGANRWAIAPQDGAQQLHVADFSADTWTSVVKPSMYVPEIDPESGHYNEKFKAFQTGSVLTRSRNASKATSAVVMWFGDSVQAQEISAGHTEGVKLTDGAQEIALIVWPGAGSVSGVAGLDATAQMAGIRVATPAIFGRAVSSLRRNGTQLVQASSPVDIFSRLQHAPTSTEPSYAIVSATKTCTLAIATTLAPSHVQLDGTDVAFTVSGGLLHVSVPAGVHRITVP